MSLIVLGSVNTDLVVRVQHLPRPGETVLGGEFFTAGGGKGANQAVAAARASTRPVTFIAAVGRDPHGEQALASFRREGLPTDFIKLSPRPTGVALIMVDERGENMISVASGANLDLLPADVDAVLDEVFRGARVFLACLESPLETVARGLARAKTAGLLTMLNPAPLTSDSDVRGLLPLVDVLTPNEGELRRSSAMVETIPTAPRSWLAGHRRWAVAAWWLLWAPAVAMSRTGPSRSTFQGTRSLPSTRPAPATRSTERWPWLWLKAAR